MIFKEEEILFPMSMDNLSEAEWGSVSKQSLEYGFCLYDPTDEWKPESGAEDEPVEGEPGQDSAPFGKSHPHRACRYVEFDSLRSHFCRQG